jgi:predicted 3-demethylubiquinone-9 3-methyltransferase (glyoxalase superfamily)
MKQKITPNLWFDGNAKEAVNYYTSIFPAGKVTNTAYYPTEGLLDFQQPLAGKELTLDFELAGHQFTAINAGPEFKPNPSISFMVNFDPAHDNQAREHLDQVWDKLRKGGEVLMELKTYPFSQRYGWVKDKYGYTWQLILTNPAGEERPCIIPSLLFGHDKVNQAEAAITFYVNVFKNAKVGNLARYPADTGPARKGSLMYGDFRLEKQWFAAMDAGVEQDFSFTEAISFVVTCQDQTEIDYYWEKLSAVPEAEQCGWCKDKYGVSWQIVPDNLGTLMKKANAFSTLMQMHKIEIDKF